uniref:Clusterin-associated protein 1 n=1 Tax=Megaselia scalaris TaxID=36166 RepID=T1GH81_MEGSC
MSLKDVREFSTILMLNKFHRFHRTLEAAGIFKTSSIKVFIYSSWKFKCFIIIADILQWLAERLEPGTILPGGVESEEDRVILIRSATEFFVTKCGIKLNPKKLYAASSATSKELQKVTNLLLTTPPDMDEKDSDEYSYGNFHQIDIGDKIEDLRRARELSSELTKKGAVLYDLLQKEISNKEERLAQSNRSMEIAQVEKALRTAIASSQAKLHSAKAQLESSNVERNSLNAKLQRKRAELERSKQRLDALQKIRPAYLQEFEELEDELRELFQQYFQRIQCRDSLKAQLEFRTKTTTPIGTPMIKQSETSMPFIPEGLIDFDEEDEDMDLSSERQLRSVGGDKLDHVEIENIGKQNDHKETARVRPTTGRMKPRTGLTLGRQKYVGGEIEDDGLDSTLGSSESDLDIGGDGVYDLNTDDDDIDLSLSKLTGMRPMSLRPKTGNKSDIHHSDDDF